MKKLAVILAMILCLFALTGCKKSAIQGTWKDDQGNEFNFNKDMTFTIDIGNDIAVGGSFAIAQNSDQVLFTIQVPEGTTIESRATFVLDDKANTLTFKGEDGTTTVLHQ